jgi:hypothetical protein
MTQIASVEEWLAERKRAGLAINRETAEVMWDYGDIADQRTIRPKFSGRRASLGIRRTRNMNSWLVTVALVGLDIGGPDYLAPLLGFIRDEFAEFSGRAHQHCAAQAASRWRTKNDNPILAIDVADRGRVQRRSGIGRFVGSGENVRYFCAVHESFPALS